MCEMFVMPIFTWYMVHLAYTHLIKCLWLTKNIHSLFQKSKSTIPLIKSMNTSKPNLLHRGLHLNMCHVQPLHSASCSSLPKNHVDMFYYIPNCNHDHHINLYYAYTCTVLMGLETIGL